MRVMHVVGARPNFPKVAPVMREINKRTSWEQFLVHSGQHYDDPMSAAFFRELAIPEPDVNLEVGRGSHAWQTARIMGRLDQVLEQQVPDWVMVYGDVNTTLAAALTAAKRGIRVAHVEAGLRCGDRKMPEEINRILTDHVSDLLLAPSVDAMLNLVAEGLSPTITHHVGNVMIDSLARVLPEARERKARHHEHGYALVTLHRPENVDDPARFRLILQALSCLAAKRHPVLLPAHPRTVPVLNREWSSPPVDCTVTPPLGYTDFVARMLGAAVVLTDSGGVQEETTYLGVPCVTLRESTERPVTIEQGTNRLASLTVDGIFAACVEATEEPRPRFCQIQRWDGKTATRIVRTLQEEEDGWEKGPD